MLAPEVAKERLKAWQIEADESRFLPEIKALPESLRAIASGLLGRDAEGEKWEAKDWQDRNRLREPAVRPLDELAPAERLRLFGVFFCGLVRGSSPPGNCSSDFRINKAMRGSRSGPRATRASPSPGGSPGWTTCCGLPHG